MRFLADAWISPETVKFLRQLGHDAVHVRELGLQRAADRELVELARAQHRIVLAFDHTARIRDFADTAALMSLLDIVISIDTSVAHLACAMGVPTWVLLALSADWRFHLERSDNPWYPTMRLFRQPSDGDWAGAIDRVVDELLRQPVQSRCS
jgi:ADP-heptose:LPS heptosyltransferase